MKKVLLVAVVVAVLLLLVVPVGVATTQLPAVEWKANGVAVIDGDVLVPVGTPSRTLACACYLLRHEPTYDIARRIVPD